MYSGELPAHDRRERFAEQDDHEDRDQDDDDLTPRELIDRPVEMEPDATGAQQPATPFRA